MCRFPIEPSVEALSAGFKFTFPQLSSRRSASEVNHQNRGNLYINMQVEIGTRVVRGHDWMWNDQDGEEGMVGTVIQTKTEGNAGSVKVLWDHGRQGIYRCGENNACDLLVFCSPIVSKHGVGCDVCLRDIIGTSWNCQECPLTHVCTACYMNDKHNTQHSFERFDTSNKPGVPMPPRAGSLRIEAKGLFPGAVVVRGNSWEWDDQDGGEGQVGNITEVQEFHSKYRRNVARVQWIGNGVTNVYRIGHNGKVDLKCIKLAGGGIYYKQHLSPLGTKMNVAAAIQKLPLKFETSVPLATNFPMEITHQTPASVFQQEAQMAGLSGNEPFSQEQEVKPIIGTMTENFVPSMQKFGIGGDRVKMIIAKEPCMSMQDGRAAWNPGMDQVPKTQMLKEGDTVKLTNDVTLAKHLYEAQVREWNDEISDCLGSIGKITKKYLDGNIRISIGKKSLIIPEEMVGDKIAQIIDLSKKQGSEVTQEIKLMQAAKCGDISEVRELLDCHPHDVNTPSLEGTPLTAAIFEEREDVVKYLMANGADINILDKNKHTAVHLAFSVGNEQIIKAVMSNDKLDTGILSGKSNLDYLQFAALCGSVTGTKQLLKRHPNLINRPSSGPAPLHYAVISSVELAKVLISEAGYDMNIRDLDQRTPLHVAIMTSNLKAAMFLVESGADLNLCDYRGNTALHMMMSLPDRQSLREHCWYTMVLKRYIGRKDQLRMENKEIVKELMNSLDMKKSWYSTDAVFGCYLIKHGADPNIKNSNNATPFSSCTRYEVAEIIKKYYERLNVKETTTAVTAEEKNRLSSLSSEDSNGSTDCRLCRESCTEATFQPCGHTITCLGCAVYFCKCFACDEDVTSFSKKEVSTDCLICDGSIADVLFEPCKHIVCCAGCAGRMVRCVYCKELITKKFDKNLQPLLPPSDAESAKYDELLNSLRNLEAKVREIESVNTCTICLDRQRNIMFLCGHGTCDICSPSLEVCPICRDPIEKKIAMF